MKNDGRYTVPTNEDAEPGSDGEVIKNYLGITSRDEIEALEKQELERAELELININKNHRFIAQDICDIHELWLGDIYPFAGKYRTVNLEKDGFPFAAPNFIPKLMTEFEKNYLSKYTPCHYSDNNELAHAIGVVHVELILIHPFREGNGRVARLLVDLMAMQANQTPLNFQYIDQIENRKGFEEYISAIHTGMSGDYLPIEKIFRILLG